LCEEDGRDVTAKDTLLNLSTFFAHKDPREDVLTDAVIDVFSVSKATPCSALIGAGIASSVAMSSSRVPNAVRGAVHG
jgi:hypothetical protein